MAVSLLLQDPDASVEEQDALLVRQFAADKKMPGRSLFLLARHREYSIVGHVFSQLFPEDYARVRGGGGGGGCGGGCWVGAVAASRPGCSLRTTTG